MKKFVLFALAVAFTALLFANDADARRCRRGKRRGGGCGASCGQAAAPTPQKTAPPRKMPQKI